MTAQTGHHLVVAEDRTRGDGDFRLRPYENASGGVSWNGDRLRLRPSIAAGALAIYGVVVLVAVAAIAISSGGVPGLVVATLAAASGMIYVRYLRCRVDAEGREITVVNRWRRRVVAAADVRLVVVQTFEPEFGFFPLTDTSSVWPGELCAGVLILHRGEHLRCDALVGLSSGPNDLSPTPVEQKVEILQRWMSAASPERGSSG